jgi:hypothetical protein
MSPARLRSLRPNKGAPSGEAIGVGEYRVGWLDPAAGTGSYPRKTDPNRDARDVYNRIVEPKLLQWLISAAGVDEERVRQARGASDS